MHRSSYAYFGYDDSVLKKLFIYVTNFFNYCGLADNMALAIVRLGLRSVINFERNAAIMSVTSVSKQLKVS